MPQPCTDVRTYCSKERTAAAQDVLQFKRTIWYPVYDKISVNLVGIVGIPRVVRLLVGLLNGLSTLVKFTKESWVTGLVAIVKDRLGWLLGWLPLPTENLVTCHAHTTSKTVRKSLEC